MKIKKAFPDRPEYADMIKFYCPACGERHIVSVGPRSFWRERWTWNGDTEKPTIRASVLVTMRMPDHEKRCHSFVTDGKIEYLGDCTHGLAGKTVELPDYPDQENQ